MTEVSDFEITIVQGRTPEVPDADAYVVIDVLRAFTTTHIAFRRGAVEILLAREVDDARRLAEAHPDYLLAGERDARPLEGFEVGNSPHDVGMADLEGRGMILTTTNGVRATTHAIGRGAEVLVTGWSNVESTLAYLRRARPQDHLQRLVLMASHPVSDEDLACADYMKARLQDLDHPSAAEAIVRMTRARSAQKFRVTETWHDADLDIALQRHPPDRAMIVDTREDRVPVVRAHPL